MGVGLYSNHNCISLLDRIETFSSQKETRPLDLITFNITSIYPYVTVLKLLFLLRLVHVTNPYSKGAQTTGTRWPGRVTFVLWRLAFVGYQYAACFMLPL
jgi:hypothetical protein